MQDNWLPSDIVIRAQTKQSTFIKNVAKCVVGRLCRLVKFHEVQLILTEILADVTLVRWLLPPPISHEMNLPLKYEVYWFIG